MKSKELNRLLIKRLNRTEYHLFQKEEENASLKEKIKGFNQLIEINQKLLMWALVQAGDELHTKELKISLNEIEEVCKKIKAHCEKDEAENTIIVRFEET